MPLAQPAFLGGHPVEHRARGAGKRTGLASTEEKADNQHADRIPGGPCQRREAAPEPHDDEQRHLGAVGIGNPAGGHLQQGIADGKDGEDVPHCLRRDVQIGHDQVAGRGDADTVHERIHGV